VSRGDDASMKRWGRLELCTSCGRARRVSPRRSQLYKPMGHQRLVPQIVKQRSKPRAHLACTSWGGAARNTSARTRSKHRQIAPAAGVECLTLVSASTRLLLEAATGWTPLHEQQPTSQQELGMGNWFSVTGCNWFKLFFCQNWHQPILVFKNCANQFPGVPRTCGN